MSDITIILNGQEIKTKPGQRVIEVIKDVEEVPHYCYHPGLSIAASCRLCAVELGQKDPETGEEKMIPKMMMSCEAVVRDHMVIKTTTEKVKTHREEIMAYLLINHPLDCPVCDQAGECELQDYSYSHGYSQSEFFEFKNKESKKDVGDDVLLYGDRCIQCTRCVRFTREVSGGAELFVNDRGVHSEIDCFPGLGVDDNLAGNVVDLCPVGALLSKDFLFKQRVWELKTTKSICGGCSKGCNIEIHHNKGIIYRIKPDHNPDVNDWWICDEGRRGFKYVHADQRLKSSQDRSGDVVNDISATEAINKTNELLAPYFNDNGKKVAVVISPQASIEEQYLLAKWARDNSNDVVLVAGAVFSDGEDYTFKGGFTVKAEKVANKNGMAAILDHFGGDLLKLVDLPAAVKSGRIEAVVISGGYPWHNWCPDDMVADLRQAKVLIVNDILESELTHRADVVLAGSSWAEKAGSFVNDQKMVQSFDQALAPVGSAKSDAEILWQLANTTEAFDLSALRLQMGRIDGNKTNDTDSRCLVRWKKSKHTYLNY